VGVENFLSVTGVRVGGANFFLGQSIGIDESNTFRKAAHITDRFMPLWALEWELQHFFGSIDRY